MSLHVGSQGSSVSALQKDLARLGLFKHSATGYFGQLTQGAVKAYERQHHLFPDGFVTAQEAVAIHSAAAHTAAKAPARPSTGHPNVAPPPANYTHVKYQGFVINVRTRAMLGRAEAYMHHLGVPGRLELSQGSFHHGSKSGTTHDGGGAVDVRVGSYSQRQRLLVARAMRLAGFAAWNRYPSDGFANHLHAIAIGDRTMSAGARSQVHAYFRGRNGLANGGPDRDAAIGRPYPLWAARFA